jgi:hypothetical protein
LTTQQPSVGRIVHYVSYGTPVHADGSQAYTSQCRAAIVAAVPEVSPHRGYADLAVLNPDGVFFKRSEQDEDQHQGGTWHWPERV